MIHTYHVIFGVIFALCLAQNFQTEVWTAQKNPFSEYRLVQYDNIWDNTNYSKESTAWQPLFPGPFILQLASQTTWRKPKNSMYGILIKQGVRFICFA